VAAILWIVNCRLLTKYNVRDLLVPADFQHWPSPPD